MPADWATIVAIPICKGKGDIMNCGMYRGVHATVEKSCNNR